MKDNEKTVCRCPWCEGTDPGKNAAMILYHDTEWGTPVRDDRVLFEHLCLESLQCGLSWSLMIRKREIFRHCFAGFDYTKIAQFTEEDVQRILEYPEMLRSAPKIRAIINNARCYEKIIGEFGSFASFMWGFTDGKTLLYRGHGSGYLPAANGLSDRVAKELRKRGFRYVGPVTIYSHLQACGVINDHVKECFRYGQLLELNESVPAEPDNER